MTFEKFTKKKSQHSDSKYQGDDTLTRDDVKKQRHLKLKMERATSRKQKKEWQSEDLN